MLLSELALFVTDMIRYAVWLLARHFSRVLKISYPRTHRSMPWHRSSFASRCQYEMLEEVGREQQMLLMGVHSDELAKYSN